ncbi:MAG: ABC transporter permease [Deltaproteobacteria bacterium]|nr:ABC transporter permease [Deltaproteobacteria bacterium]
MAETAPSSSPPAAPAAAPKNPAPSPASKPPATRSAFRLRKEPTVLGRFLAGALFLLLVLGLWTALTRGAAEARVLSPAVIGSPEEILGSFRSLWFDRALTRNLIASLWRVLQGFGLAALVGVPLGVACGTWPRINAFIAPLSVFGRNVPISALVPLTLVWFGIDELQKVMFIFVACVMFVVFDSARAIAGVDERYVHTALTLGAKPWQVVLKVLVPLALPDIFGSLRLLFGLAFGYIILAEMVNMSDGVGALILISQRRGPMEHVYLVLVALTLVAYGIDRGLLGVQRWLFPYREEEK